MSTSTSTLTPLPGAPPDTSTADINLNLPVHYLSTYRHIFYQALETEKVQPFLLPFCLVGAFILPIAYLCIPQYTVTTIQGQQVRTRREWIHHLRWVVGAVMVWWNLGVVVGLPGFGGSGKTTASACTAIAYAAGLMCGWGTIWGLETVVFGGHQGTAMRVRRRLRSATGHGQPSQVKDVDLGGKADGKQSGDGKKHDGGNQKIALPRTTSTSTETTETNKAIITNRSHSPAEKKQEDKGQRWTVDETVDLEKYEYYWEPYPDQGTLLERLDWVMDVFNSFRGAGWSYSISSIPSRQKPVIPPLPASILTSSSTTSASLSRGQILPFHPSGLPVSFNNLPLSTPQNFHRPLTVRQFLTSRLWHITWSYLILDFFTISARLDPYFVLGPNGPLRHPDHLTNLASSSPSTLPPLSLACAKLMASLPPWALDFARSLFSMSGVLGGLFLYSYLWQLTQFFVLGQWLGNETQGMNELWRYPCLFGGFVTNVLDRGLAGFWGGWWHQTFRLGFTGPIRFLVKVGLFAVQPDEGDQAGGREKRRKRKLIAMAEMAVAFFMSGVLHALGGWTSTAFRITPSSPSPSSGPGKDLLTGDTRNRLAVFAEPVAFFVSQFFGCLIQAFLIVVLRNFISKTMAKITGREEKNGRWKEMPRWLKRTGNGLFVLMWLQWTRWMLIDDMSRSGLFLFEPVPVSVFRLLGLGGMPGEGRKDWWRLDGEYVPSLWRGRGWWQTGVRM